MLKMFKSIICALLLAMLPLPILAHEVQPAVADIEVGEREARMEITFALEGLVTGIDLGAIQDTNDSPLSGLYDRFRAMPPAELDTAFRQEWPRLGRGIILLVGEARIPAELVDIRIPEVGDTDLSRESTLVLRATLPENDAPVRAGWIASYGPLILRQAGQGDELYSGYLTNGALSDPLPRDGVAQLGALEEFTRYVVLGFEHILPLGADHIVFVLGLFFFSLAMRPLLIQVTAFTVAHTVSLALGTLGIVTVSPQIVEPLIALSIVYVAIENIIGGQIGLRRTAVVFGFGLLHGLGFATMLGGIGLNTSRFVLDLVGFNIGVEIGQLTVISLAYLTLGLWFGKKPWYRGYIAVPASALISVAGGWWFIERTLL